MVASAASPGALRTADLASFVADVFWLARTAAVRPAPTRSAAAVAVVSAMMVEDGEGGGGRCGEDSQHVNAHREMHETLRCALVIDRRHSESDVAEKIVGIVTHTSRCEELVARE